MISQVSLAPESREVKEKMANVRSPKHSFFFLFLAFMLAVLVQTSAQVVSNQHKVGDLDAWGIPTSANPLVYAKWSKYHTFRIGDSLLFLYPPSQDSVIQVTQQSYNSCNITDPILYMNNGNSLFNITAFGDLFFTSGEPGHCGKKQKLHISVLSGNASAAYSPSYGPSALPEISPSYPTVFGTIPAPPSSSSPSPNFPVLMASAFGFVVCALLGGIM